MLSQLFDSTNLHAQYVPQHTSQEGHNPPAMFNRVLLLQGLLAPVLTL